MKRLFFASILSILSLGALASQASTPSRQSRFIAAMVKEYHFKKVTLAKLLANLPANQSILKKIKTPYEKKSWAIYRRHFITPQRIKGGIRYEKNHLRVLKDVRAQYGVPPYVATAIIGVETSYGQYLHQYNELDALTTLAFHYPPRSPFFTNELKQYLLLTREFKLDPQKLRGSYAGALGIPQFMPSSYRRFAVDYNKNGKIDLLNDHDDAIASIGNYLKKNGWVAGEPVAIRIKKPSSKLLKHLSSNAKPEHVWRYFKRRGVTPYKGKAWIKGNTPAALIKMGDKKPTYWITFPNFQAIMSYNPRIAYAMAVFQLSQAIRHG